MTVCGLDNAGGLGLNCGMGELVPMNAGFSPCPGRGCVYGMMSKLCGVDTLFVKVTTTLSPCGTVTTTCPCAAPLKLKPASLVSHPAISVRLTVVPVVVTHTGAGVARRAVQRWVVRAAPRPGSGPQPDGSP